MDRIERTRVGTRWAVVIVVLAVLLAGCTSTGNRWAHGGRRVFLTVDFEPGQTLRYKFVSRRTITLDWDPTAELDRNRVQERSEHVEIIVAYTPVEVDPYGVSTIRANVESVRATRSGGLSGRSLGPDAVESAQGRTFTLKVDPRGRIVDPSQLDALIREMGEKAFRSDTSQGRVKEPDMIGDFVAGQWFLWDAVSSVQQPADGVTIGQRWSSQLSVPTPMVIRRARDVAYRLEEVRPGEEGPMAVIGSTYSLADSRPADWPVPYSGRFQMSGTFGFLGPYEVQGLEGAGEELFDVETGRVERVQQKYTMRMKASLPPMGIQANPQITIEQALTMELMREGS